MSRLGSIKMQQTGPALPPDVLAAIGRRDYIQAIKLLRQSTGLGLKEAKERVDQQTLGMRAHVPQSPAPHALPSNVVDALSRGDKIDAIRLLREATGLGLKEAKDVVGVYQGSKLPTPTPTPTSASKRTGLAPGQVPASGSQTWVVLTLLGLALAASYFFLR